MNCRNLLKLGALLFHLQLASLSVKTDLEC